MDKELERRCRELNEGFKEQIKLNPKLSLKSYCESMGANYDSLEGWNSRRGIFVRDLKAEVWPNTRELFVPLCSRTSSHLLLTGVNITFPDKVSLHLEECGVEELVSLLTLYENRRQMKEVGRCSL